MKKQIIAFSVVALFALSSQADLSISFVNNSHGITTDSTPGSEVYLPAGSLVQLIWAPVDNIASRFVSGAGVGGALKAGEFLLVASDTSEPTPWTGYGTWSSVVGGYDSSDVGGADINTGYFFARIFVNNAAYGTPYYETTAVDAADWMFDSNDPANQKPYDDSIVKYDGEQAGTISLEIQANATTVIPEPGTFGLMGLAGLGLFMARRSALKKARRI